jgi:signal transduction histidine kinase
MMRNQITKFRNSAAPFHLGAIALAMVILVFFRPGVDLASTTFMVDATGIGKGLSICRSIVEAQEGRLSASGNAGLSATFQFILSAYMRVVS